MSTVTLTFNLGDFTSFAFLGFLTILAVKFIVSILALIFLPKLDGQSFWTFAALMQKLIGRWFLSLVCAVIVALVVCLVGGTITPLLIVCAILGVIGSFI